MAFSKARRLGELVTTAGVLYQATVATASSGDNDTSPASTAFVTGAIADLADSAPSTLNTLNELAAALGDDANFSTTVTNSIATKLPLAGGTLTGNLILNGADITKSGSADLNINSGGRIDLSADDNGEVRLYDGTSLYAQFKDDDNRLRIQTLISDADIMFVGNDGGSEVTAMTIDMSENGRIGIGTGAPAAPLHVSTAVAESVVNFDCTQRYTQVDWKNSGTQKGAIWTDNTDERFAFYTPSGWDIDFWAGATLRMSIDSSGSITMNNLYGSAADQNDVRYNASSGLLFYNTSSRRYKENIKDMPDGVLDKIKQAKVVTFDEKETGISSYGLIAEDLNEIIPELVVKKEIDGEEQPDSIVYSKIGVWVLKAMQEQQIIIEDLKARIETLEG